MHLKEVVPTGNGNGKITVVFDTVNPDGGGPQGPGSGKIITLNCEADGVAVYEDTARAAAHQSEDSLGAGRSVNRFSDSAWGQPLAH